MMRTIGVPAQMGGGTWTYVDTSGDPYIDASPQQLTYINTHLVNKPEKILWDMLPPPAAVILSFIRCAPYCSPHKSQNTDVYELPGRRTILVVDSDVVGYNDFVARMLYIPKVTSDIDSNWKYLLSKLWRADSIATGIIPAPVHGDAWTQVLVSELREFEVLPLTEDTQARLKWELRIRTKAGT